MTFLIFLVWGLFGFVAGAMIGTELGPLFGFRHMEGSSAIFGTLFGGPCGAVVGGVLGLVLSRRFAGSPGTLKALAAGPVTLAALVVGGTFLFETIRTSDLVDSSGGTKSIGYRVRLPVGAPSPAGERIGVELRSEKENPACSIYSAPYGLTQEGGRFIVSGDCPIRYATAKRVIAVRIADGPNLLFRLRMQARPEVIPYSASAWYPVDEVQDTAAGSQPRPPKADEAGYEVLMSAR